MAKNQFAGAHVININDMSTSPESRLHQIHKIHSISQDKEKKDYEPSHLSIGPYHHGSPALRATEKLKWWYLNYFLNLNHEKSLHDYLKVVNGLEKQARSFYGDEIKMDRKSFVEMLLLDACFILITLNGTNGIAPDCETPVEEIMMDDQNNDQLVIDVDENTQIIGTNKWHANSHEDDSYDIDVNDVLSTKVFLRDMLLLENQIPFFVVIKVFEVLTSGRSLISLLVGNIVQSMKYMLGCHPEAIQVNNPPEEIYHLLHLCHIHFKPHRREEEKCKNHDLMSLRNFLHFGNNVLQDSKQNLYHQHRYDNVTVRSVMQYHEARIKLKKREFSSETPHSLLDIRFVNGILEIPHLSIDPETFTLLKNLITFELICPQSGNYFTSYVLFWSQFITTPDDVALLIEKEIIKHNFHTDSEVVGQLRSLANCSVFNLNGENYLTSLCHMMEVCYRIWRPKWKEWFLSIKSKVLYWTLHSTPELPVTNS